MSAGVMDTEQIMWHFGTAGTPDSYDGKGTVGILPWLRGRGLNAFEYQCGRGVRVSDETALQLRETAAENGIRLSLHAPYYISLSSTEMQKRINSVDYILQSAEAADRMGADRIIVHSGSVSGMERGDAVSLAESTLAVAVATLAEAGLGHITICPETMGKQNQLGTVEEVCRLCLLDERMVPCVDFGHLYARSLGETNDKASFSRVLDTIGGILGAQRLQKLHIHFSHIEFTDGGERRHLNFSDGRFGPDFEPLCEALCDFGVEPVIISESAGEQELDAAEMKRIYEEVTLRGK